MFSKQPKNAKARTKSVDTGISSLRFRKPGIRQVLIKNAESHTQPLIDGEPESGAEKDGKREILAFAQWIVGAVDRTRAQTAIEIELASRIGRPEGPARPQCATEVMILHSMQNRLGNGAQMDLRLHLEMAERPAH